MKRILSLMMAALLLCSCAFAEEAVSPYYMLGDKVEDFTVTLSDGQEMTLSKLLETKELVVLNFWATWCGPCQMEFPFMEESYLKHQDKMEIIALSVEPTDDSKTIEAFKAANGLTALPMGQDTIGLSRRFLFDGIPTTVVIDRFGVVCWQESGSITSTDRFDRLFGGFLGEDYTQSKVGYEIPGPSPTVANADDATLTAALNAEGSTTPVTNDADPQVWPFLPTEGGALKSTNAGYDETRASVHATVSAKAGDAMTFDYVLSSETGMDYLLLEINGVMVDIFSGEEAGTFAYAFTADGDHAVTLTYLKNMTGSAGEDCALIDNLQVLSGEEAAQVIDALPKYPLTLEGTAYEIVPLTGKQAIVNDATGLYDMQMGMNPSYVVGGNEATFLIKLGKDLNPKLALVAEDCTGSVYAVNTLAQTEDGFIVTLPVSSVETGGYSSTYVTLYPNYLTDLNHFSLLYIYANEENLNFFVTQELPAYLGLTDVTWTYAEGTAPATDAVAQLPTVMEIPEGMPTYTAVFVDQNGDPVPNVMAQICDETTCEVLPSDESGIVTFTKSPYPYEIHVLMAPEGYTFDTEVVYTMPEAGGELVIQGTKN